MALPRRHMKPMNSNLCETTDRRKSVVCLAAIAAYLNLIAASAGAFLPVARAPFARSGLERRPVEMRTAHCFWPGNRNFTSRRSFTGVSFECGGKRAVVAGIDRHDINNPILFGRIPIYRDADRLGMVCINSKWNYRPIDGNDRLDIDEKAGTATWSRRCALPDGSTNVLSYMVRGCDDGRIFIDWSLGLDAAAAHEKGTLPFIVAFNPAGEARPEPKDCTLTFGSEEKGDYLSFTYPKAWQTWSKWYVGKKPGDHHYRFNIAGNFKNPRWAPPTSGRIVLDFGRTSELDVKPLPPYDGVDFWGANAWDVPHPPTRNLMVNGSFEQRWKGWRWTWGGAKYSYAPPGQEHYGIVDGGLFGEKAMIVRTNQPEVVTIASPSVPTLAGRRYTVSWYAKSPSGKKAWHYVKVCSAGRGGTFNWLAKPHYKCATGEWTRHEMTFEADAAGVYLMVNAGNEVLIDGIQLEKGDHATPYVDDPVIGTLLTANDDNDLRPGEPIGARLKLQAKEGVSGTVTVTVKNYYSESVFARTLPIASGEFPLDLDPKKLGTGIFIVRLAYALAPNQTIKQPNNQTILHSWTDYQRFAISEPLDNTHPTARFFCGMPWFARVERGADVARKMKEWGLGAIGCQSGGNGVYVTNPDTAALCRTNDIRMILHPVAYEGNFHKEIRSYKPEDVTPELLGRWENYAYTNALRCAADDTLWTWYNEEESWVREKGGFENHFKLVQACYRGCKRAFDERGLKLRFAPTHGCSHYFHGRNYDAIDGYLETAKRHGFKYDAVTIHSYQNIDGSVLGPKDADLETDHLIERMRHYGYDEKTPILFSECFNMLNMYIPEWGAMDWADFSWCGMPSQDLGNREFLHAATMARLFILALKHWPQVCLVNPWQFLPGFLDHNLTPFMWLKMVNTLGHLFPDPRFYGEAQPFATVRAKAFRQGDRAILAIWTNDNDVERGLKRGQTLTMELPSDAQFIDLMGNVRRARASVPLTPAPLFIVSKDAEGLLKAAKEAESDDVSVSVGSEIRPTAEGGVALDLVNLTRRTQQTAFGALAPLARKTVPLAAPQAIALMKWYSFATNFPFLKRPCELAWFYVPRCGEKPDWANVPALPIANEVRRDPAKSVTMKANFRAAWNPQAFFLRVEIEDDIILGRETYTDFQPHRLYRCDGCLEVYFDGFADARAQASTGFDLNDMRYDFVYGQVWRQLAVNWQLAQGTQSATDAEVQQKLVQRVEKTATGYAYEIAIAARYLAPIDLKAGTRASIGLFIHDRDTPKDKGENGLSLATEPGKVCNLNPHLWPEFILQ